MVEQQLVERARQDPGVFAEYAMGLNLCEMHREWLWIVDNHLHSAIFAPRNHGKTTLLSVAYAIWRLGKDNNLRIKIACQNDTRASLIVGEISENILSNPRVHKVFPNLIPNEKRGWSKTSLYVMRTKIMKDPSVEAAGVLSSVTGGRFDLLLCDDLVDYKNAIQTPALRPMVQESFYSSWLNLAEGPDSQVVYVATLWTDKDLSYHILTKDCQTKGGSFFVKLYRIDEHFTPLWEWKWPAQALKRRCKQLGWYSFNRAFRNMVVSEDDALFDKTAIDNMRMAGVGVRPDDYLTCPKYTGVDLAIGKGRHACFTSIFTVALTPELRRVPVDIVFGHYTSPQTARALYEQYNMWRSEVVYVENNAYQQALLDWCAELIPDLPCEAHYTGSQKMDFDIGIPSLAVEMEHSRWILPQGPELHPDDCQCKFCVWTDQLRAFPHGANDILLSSWLARECIRKHTIQSDAGFSVWDLAAT